MEEKKIHIDGDGESYWRRSHFVRVCEFHVQVKLQRKRRKNHAAGATGAPPTRATVLGALLDKRRGPRIVVSTTRGAGGTERDCCSGGTDGAAGDLAGAETVLLEELTIKSLLSHNLKPAELHEKRQAFNRLSTLITDARLGLNKNMLVLAAGLSHRFHAGRLVRSDWPRRYAADDAEVERLRRRIRLGQ